MKEEKCKIKASTLKRLKEEIKPKVRVRKEMIKSRTIKFKNEHTREKINEIKS